MPSGAATDIIFYDGTCGLCHGTVKWVLTHDAEGDFRFAPLQSEAFEESVPAESRTTLPDSVVVLTHDGQILTRSSATLYIIDRVRVGGLWRVLAGMVRVIPKPIRDFFYDAVARVRYRIFGRSETACPILPPHLRERFLQ
jgi:predicted DCC family thiol-disulfide oxidoreductase YuxK